VAFHGRRQRYGSVLREEVDRFAFSSQGSPAELLYLAPTSLFGAVSSTRL
jgi:hypothetical protein